MPGEVPTDVPPAAFGRFRVLHQIGVGSLGPVFRGEDPDTHEAVVIKQFRLNLAPELAGRVVERLRGLATSVPNHPTVTRVIDAGLHRLDPYLVTELAIGESLDVALREYGPAAIGDALPRLQRLADALDRAAAQGIWHGALQPRDILVSARATQMTGLGVAPILEGAGIHRSPRRPYAAPEIVAGGDSSTASDQYALAAITYEWLFGGRAPRSAESVLDAPLLQGVNAEALAGALMTALAANPTDRFASCSGFVAALDAAVTDAARTVPAAGVRPAPLAVALPLPPDADEPSGKDALLPDDQIVEIVPPTLGLGALDATPDDDFTPPLTFEPEEPTKPISPLEKAGAVAWQGTLGSADPVRAERARGFTTGTLVAVLLGGLAVGAIAGYLAGTTRTVTPDPSTPPIIAEQPAPPTQPAAPDRESTNVPVAAAPDRRASPTTTKPAAPVAAPPSAPVAKAPTAVPRPPTPTPAKTAQLLVRSSPAGASVSVDGTPRGRTPLTLDLALGARTILLSRAGFAPSERRVTLTADRPSRSIDVQLVPLAPPRPAREARSAAGSLLVESRPSGASVTIDGKPAGVTPVTVASIAPGQHTIRLELAGFRPLTHTAVVKAGERLRVAASLEGGQPQE